MTPLIIEAEAVQRDPAGALFDFWAHVGLEAKPEALAWKSEGLPEDWADVAGWHADVKGSRGIHPPESEAEVAAAFAAAAAEEPRLAELLAWHEPHYRQLKALAKPSGAAQASEEEA